MDIKKYIEYLSSNPSRLLTLLLPNLFGILSILGIIINPDIIGTDPTDGAFKVVLIIILVAVPIFNTIHSIKTFKKTLK